MKKKLVIGMAALAMIGTLAVGGTLAWLTDSESTSSVVTVGNVNIAWFEKSASQESFTEITDGTGIQYGSDAPVTPGATLTKETKVKNTGKNGAYIRAKINYKEKQENGEYVVKEKPDYITYELKNNTNWKQKGDYYYYMEILGRNSETDLLLEGITISGEATNDDLADKDFSVTLVAEAIQSDNTGVTLSGDPTADVETLSNFFTGKMIKEYEEK